LTQIKPDPQPLLQRLLWFAALWLGGVGAVALISFGLRLWIAPKSAFHDAPMKWAVGKNRRHFSDLSATLALNLPSSRP